MLGIGGLALQDLSTSGEGIRSRNIPNPLCNLHRVITTHSFRLSPREGNMHVNGKVN